MNIILTLRPTIDCKITLSKYNFFIKQAEQRKLLISFNNENIFLQIFPIDNALCFNPYIVMLSLSNNELTSESNQIEIIKNCTNNYDILITPKNFTHQNQNKILHLPKTYAQQNPNTAQNQNENIILNGTLLTILCSNNPPLYFNLKSPMQSPKVQTQNDCYIISNKEPNNTKLKQLAILNPKTNKLKSFYCHHFRIDSNSITIITELKDYANHIKVLKLALDNDLSKLDCYTGITSPPKLIQNTKIIPYAFLQNIKAKDFKEARKYLNENFSQNLSNNTLAEFFGKFSHLTTPQIKSPPFTICLTYKNNHNSFISRYFHFKFDKYNKIENIEEVYPPFKILL